MEQVHQSHFSNDRPSVDYEDTSMEADALTLSSSQERLWFLDQWHPGQALYNVPYALHFHGPIDSRALATAIERLLQRHEVLRTRFPVYAGVPVQDVRSVSESLHWNISNDALDDASLQHRLLAEARTPFDLEHGPLLRALLLRADSDRPVLVLTLHHIVTDGLSMRILWRDLSELYAAACAARPPRLPELPIQYADYAAWQRNWIEHADTHREYWINQLAGFSGVLDLPTDRPRPPVQSMRGACLSHTLPPALRHAVYALALNEGVTPFMTLLAVFQALLQRYCGSDDIVVGIPVANRPHVDLEHLVGLFVNTLAIRTDLSGQPTVAQLLARVRTTMLGAFAHAELPFDHVVDAVRPERSLSYMPLCQVMLSMLDAESDGLVFDTVSGDLAELDIASAKFDLGVNFTDSPVGLTLLATYSTDLFDADTIARLLANFETLLQAFVSAARDRPVPTLDLLSDAERRLVLETFNDTQADYPGDTLIQQLVENQAACRPDAVALVHDSQTLNYGQLNRRANQLAHALIARGVRPDDRVALCVERGFDMIVGVLAVLKAGGAYVPLDPAYPAQRLSYMLDDCAPVALLTHVAIGAALPSTAAPLIVLDHAQDSAHIARFPDTNPDPVSLGLDASNLAYIIYTSGSTGMPKGVCIEHRNLANLIHWHWATFALDASHRVSCVAKFGFDACAWEIWPTLGIGATLVLPTAADMADPDTLLDWWDRQSLDAAFLPTPIAELALSRPLVQTSLKTLVTGGDRLIGLPSQPLPFRFTNNYGPTETTIITTSWTVDPFAPQILVGRPIANSAIYILDPHRQPVPVGVPGEIYVGGAGVARGYLDRVELTTARFLADPFSPRPGARMYRTGDIGRFLPDGNIDFIGRNDFQVKIRGVRIELGEIEARLARHPAILQAVAGVTGRHADNHRLVAYCVASPPDRTLDFAALRADLLLDLPEHAVPSAYVQLPTLPLTPNGKIDRNALPIPDPASFAAHRHENPQGAVEIRVAEIWRDLLDVERVGRHDNFFEMGGNSLIASRLVSQLRALGMNVSVRAVFETNDLRQLCERLSPSDTASQPAASPLSRISRTDALTLSSSQERLWFLDQWHPGQALYNVPYALHFHGPIDSRALATAIERLLQRHEVLRTRFPVYAGVPVQDVRSVSESLHWNISNDALDDASLQHRLLAEARTPFDLEHGPLLRALLLRADSDRPVLVLTLHHIVTDGLSMRILWRDLSELYAAACAARPPRLPELPIQYADYAAWQRNWIEHADTHREYWINQLAGFSGVLDLPTDRPRPPVQSMRGACLSHTLPPALRHAVYALALNEGVTPFMTLLAVFQALLQRYCGSDDIVVGIPVANRPHVDLEHLVGLFVNTLAIRTDLSGQPTVAQLLARVRTTMLGAFAHAELPFDHVVDAVRPERSLSYMPLCQVMLSMLDAESDGLVFDTVSGDLAELDIASAKFDLGVNFTDSPVGLTLLATYSTDLFDADTIARLLANFETLLQAFVSAARDRPVPTLDLLSDAERRLVLETFNDTQADYPGDTLIQQLVENQAACRPDAVALVHDSQTLNYGQLNRRANQLAHALIARGVRPDDRVALCVERGFDMIVGVLAVLKAGGAYVPLDPAYPAQRLSYMLDDCAPVALLTHVAIGTALPSTAAPLIVLDHAQDAAHIASFPDTNPEPVSLGLDASNLAYIIYTSGSTGMPKGVMGHHRGMCNLASAQAARFGVSTDSRILQFASLSFDVSISEYLMALCAGGSLLLARKERLYPGEPLLSTIAEHAPTHISLPPSALAALPERSLAAAVTIVVAGEICPPALAARWSTTHRMFNAYGPTETTVYATLHVCCPEASRTVPIGRPIANTQIYILDAHGQPSPVNATGEIHIGGLGVAYGYLNRAVLTRERFVKNPFSVDPSARMYRTGDLGRWLPDGTIECLGRNDFQVKLRGFRIELGEIEGYLCQHEGVREAVVVAREDKHGNKRLIAYWVAADVAQTPDVVRLRRHLVAHLPEYMVPSALVQLKQMPLTDNGKIDRSALPQPDDGAYASGMYRAPHGALEEGLAKLWADLLQISRVGVDDNFFDLGGHSMLALQMRASLRNDFGIDISIVDLFSNATIRSLIAYLERDGQTRSAPSPSSPRAELARRFFARQQHRIKRQP